MLIGAQNPGCTVRDAVQYVVWPLRESYSTGCAVQRREEEDWQLFEFTDLLISLQVPPVHGEDVLDPQ